MSATIRAAGPSDMNGIATFLHRQMNDALSPGVWRRIMDYPWHDDKPDLGQVAVDGERIVGFMGKIFADRDIGGRTERLCNMSSVYVDAAYRRQGIGTGLHEAVTADPDVTYYVFDPSPYVRSVTTHPKLGFRVLDDMRYVWQRLGAARASVDVVTDPEAVASRLTDGERRLVQDHLPYPLQPYLLQDRGEHCLVFLYRRTSKRGDAQHEALYVGNPSLFARCAQDFADWLLADPKAILMIDRRFLRGQPVAVEPQAIPVPRYFKSTRLEAADIDHLYSEIPLLL